MKKWVKSYCWEATGRKKGAVSILKTHHTRCWRRYWRIWLWALVWQEFLRETGGARCERQGWVELGLRATKAAAGVWQDVRLWPHRTQRTKGFGHVTRNDILGVQHSHGAQERDNGLQAQLGGGCQIGQGDRCGSCKAKFKGVRVLSVYRCKGWVVFWPKTNSLGSSWGKESMRNRTKPALGIVVRIAVLLVGMKLAVASSPCNMVMKRRRAWPIRLSTHRRRKGHRW